MSAARLQRMKWGVDVDGVLSIFDQAYVNLLADIEPSLEGALNAALPPKKWFWTEDVVGLTPAHEKEAWRRIEDSECFWHDCASYPDVEQFLSILTNLVKDPGIAVYFITSRPGRFSKVQTEWWLEERGMDRPTVLIAPGDKAPLIRGLGLDLMIDDRPETITHLQTVLDSDLTKVYCQDRPWNQHVVAHHRVANVMTLLAEEGVFA